MADSPGAANGASNGASDLGIDVDALGAQMAGHLVELVGAWTQQMTALAEAGIDPTPLVQALARTLRATADQLDAAGAARR